MTSRPRLAEAARATPSALWEETTLLLVLRIDASAVERPRTADTRPWQAFLSHKRTPLAFVSQDERLIVALGEAVGGTTGFVGVVDGLSSPVGQFPRPTQVKSSDSWGPNIVALKYSASLGGALTPHLPRSQASRLQAAPSGRGPHSTTSENKSWASLLRSFARLP